MVWLLFLPVTLGYLIIGYCLWVALDMDRFVRYARNVCARVYLQCVRFHAWLYFGTWRTWGSKPGVAEPATLWVTCSGCRHDAKDSWCHGTNPQTGQRWECCPDPDLMEDRSPCTCTLACIPQGITEDQFCRERGDGQ